MSETIEAPARAERRGERLRAHRLPPLEQAHVEPSRPRYRRVDDVLLPENAPITNE